MVSEIDNDADNKFLTENLKLDEEGEQMANDDKNAAGNTNKTAQPKQDSLITKELYFERALDKLEEKLDHN